MLKVSQSALEKLLRDPVMAAHVILGMEFDTFQKARLRTYWWVPHVTDNSGVSTGKTAVDFAYLCLRVILCGRLDNHVAAVYFPNFQTMKDEFWPYFDATIGRSDIFRSLLKIHNGKVGEHKDPGAWWMEFKDGSRIVAPAPGFMQDSMTQASRRFNTLVVDDYLRAMDMGEGIEKQLIDRVTRPCFNQEHPVWANHVKLLGHAEKPSHRGYARYKAARRAIADGDTGHAVISFCHLDWSDRPVGGSTFRKKYCPTKVIKEQKRVLSWDQYCRQWLGIWSRDGQNYYPETVLARAWQRMVPLLGRQFEDEINVLGLDFAPGVSVRSDFSSAAIFRAVPIGENRTDKTNRTYDGLTPNWFFEGKAYHASFTFASMPKGLDAPRMAQFIHMLHRAFGFSKIVMDPGGGGLWVYPELKRDQLLIDGVAQKFQPLCAKTELMQSGMQPIISWFKRGADFDDLMEPQYLSSDEGFIAFWHLQFRMAWEGGHIAVPMAMEERSPAEIRGWTPDQVWAQRILDTGMKQLNNVRQLTKDGEVVTSRRGFPMFQAVGKKDVAYAMWYAWCGMQALMRDAGAGMEMDAEDCFGVM
jgi:hypothetical protein